MSEVEKLVERLGETAHYFESTGYAHGRHIAKARAAREAASTLQSQARRVEELEGALRKIARDGHGLQGIIEDHPGDTKARARAEASYWQAEVTWRRRHARSALSEGSGSSRELAPPDESGDACGATERAEG